MFAIWMAAPITSTGRFIRTPEPRNIGAKYPTLECMIEVRGENRTARELATACVREWERILDAEGQRDRWTSRSHEASKRAAQIDAGEVELISAEEVDRKARALLR